MRISDWSSDVCSSDLAHLGARHAGHLEGRHALRRAAGQFDLDLAFGQRPLAQHLAELLPGLGAGAGADQGVDHPLLGRQLGLGVDLAAHALAGHADRHLDQVTDDRLDIAADIADLGELGRLRSAEHTSELQSLMRISYSVFCLKKKNNSTIQTYYQT